MDTRYGTRDFWESIAVLTDGNVAMKRLELRCQFVRRRKRRRKKNHTVDFFCAKGEDEPFAARDHVVVNRKFGLWQTF